MKCSYMAREKVHSMCCFGLEYGGRVYACLLVPLAASLCLSGGPAQARSAESWQRLEVLVRARSL